MPARWFARESDSNESVIGGVEEDIHVEESTKPMTSGVWMIE